MVSTTEKLWTVAEEREWTNMSPDQIVRGRVVPGEDWLEGFETWTFEKERPASGNVQQVSYGFWDGYGDYALEWNYDENQDAYLRTMGTEPHLDLNNDEQIAAKNVVVLFTTEKGPINEKKHLIYGTTGTGDALIFKHGEAVEATWTKQSRTDELHFVDSSGDDIPMARGLTWISVVGLTNEVDY
jgi:hypothetical protein